MDRGLPAGGLRRSIPSSERLSLGADLCIFRPEPRRLLGTPPSSDADTLGGSRLGEGRCLSDMLPAVASGPPCFCLLGPASIRLLLIAARSPSGGALLPFLGEADANPVPSSERLLLGGARGFCCPEPLREPRFPSSDMLLVGATRPDLA